MSVDTIISNIRKKYHAAFGEAGTVQFVPTQHDNAPFTKPDPGDDECPVWVRWNIRPGIAMRRDFGEVAPNRRFRTPGVVIANVFSAIGKGQSPALAVAGKIKTEFLDQTEAGVVYSTPSIEVIGRSDDGWWQINVTCEWYADTFE